MVEELALIGLKYGFSNLSCDKKASFFAPFDEDDEDASLALNTQLFEVHLLLPVTPFIHEVGEVVGLGSC